MLWLRTFGVDISCVKITPHKVNSQIVIVPTRIIPIEEVDTYTVDIREKQESTYTETQQRRRRQQETMAYLLEKGLLKAGDRIYLKHEIRHLTYNSNDATFHATITGKRGQSNAVKWEKDQMEYSISRLTWNIFEQTHPENKAPGGVNGNWHWVDQSDTPLWKLAADHRGTSAELTSQEELVGSALTLEPRSDPDY